MVKTADGDGVVVEIKPLAKEIKVRLNDNDKDAPKLYRCQDVKVISRPSKQAKQKDDDDDVFED